MDRLSSPIEAIKDHYPVVVIGSGYGGAIAASRLARAGQQVCVLERGREIHPGAYPRNEKETKRETQSNLPLGHLGRQTALYDLHINDDMSVLVGCGLGGTSLINANVALRPDARVFADRRWPQAFRDDIESGLAEGFRHAEAMLRPVPYPEGFQELPKLDALCKSAAALNAECSRVPINVTFEDGVNHVGIDQKACVLCGDCVAGCNYWAKNTTLMNYLPDARNHDADFFTLVSVQTVERSGGRWLVHYEVLGPEQEELVGPTSSVSADTVILSAGTLGTAEILLRSEAAGLRLSGRLGHDFSGNGDVGGVAYNADQVINAVGFGPNDPGDIDPVGPTIAGVIDMRDEADLEDGVIIEEGAIQGSLAKGLPLTLAKSALLVGKDTDRGLVDRVREIKRVIESLIRGSYYGAVKHSQVFLVMAHDDSGGQLTLEDDRIRITWPGIGDQPFVMKVNEYLLKATRAIGGTFVENPLWSKLPSHNMVTAHPLGGCIMAEDAGQGVVNHKGQVFSEATGTAVYQGLYVCDGAVIPRSLGANPLLTISAVAERCCALLAEDNGWEIDYGNQGLSSLAQ
jgi:cholesterol oxidase